MFESGLKATFVPNLISIGVLVCYRSKGRQTSMPLNSIDLHYQIHCL